jgi:hypothetical protein
MAMALGGLRLALQVGGGDHVVVHQGQPAHPRPDQGLGAPAPRTAQSEHRYMDAGQFFFRLFTAHKKAPF